MTSDKLKPIVMASPAPLEVQREIKCTTAQKSKAIQLPQEIRDKWITRNASNAARPFRFTRKFDAVATPADTGAQWNVSRCTWYLQRMETSVKWFQLGRLASCSSSSSLTLFSVYVVMTCSSFYLCRHKLLFLLPSGWAHGPLFPSRSLRTASASLSLRFARGIECRNPPRLDGKDSISRSYGLIFSFHFIFYFTLCFQLSKTISVIGSALRRCGFDAIRDGKLRQMNIWCGEHPFLSFENGHKELKNGLESIQNVKVLNCARNTRSDRQKYERPNAFAARNGFRTELFRPIRVLDIRSWLMRVINIRRSPVTDGSKV